MSTAKDELFDWWAVVSRQDAEMVVPKAAEYGSNSLEQVGRKVAQLQGRTVEKAEALELGAWMYAVGKMERWTDSVMRGDRVSVDTLTDLGVYATMARRIREVGDWPGRNVGSTCYHGDLDCERCDHHARPLADDARFEAAMDEYQANTTHGNTWVEIGYTTDESTFKQAVKNQRGKTQADPNCLHKAVNVHTIQPVLDPTKPETEIGAGTCLDCGREVPVKNPRGYTPSPNGAHE